MAKRKRSGPPKMIRSDRSSLVKRDPALPGPTPGQIAEAVADRNRRSPVTFSAIQAHKPFHLWLAGLNDPFVNLYLETYAQLSTVTISALGAEVLGEVDESLSADLRRLAVEAVPRIEQAQKGALARLAERVKEVDPLPLLCGIMFLTKFERWGAYFEPHSPPTDLDLELVAGIVASDSSTAKRQITVDDWEAVAEAAKEVRWWAYTLVLAHSFTGDQSLEKSLRRELLDRYLAFRGEAYPDHAVALSRALAEGRDQNLARQLGFALQDVIDVAAAVHRRWEQGVTPVLDQAWQVAQARTGEEPQQLGNCSLTFRRIWASEVLASLPSALAIPLDGNPQLLPPHRFAEEQAVLRALAIKPGGYPEVESVLVDPPQRTSPFITLPAPDGSEPSHALLIHPAGLTTDLHLTIEAVLARKAPKWPVARAKAVDNHAVHLLQRSLPGSIAHTNVFIEGESGLEEVDGVVLFEDVAILIEGKGAPLKLAAKRGSVDKLIRQLRDLVGEGWRQLERDTRYLTANRRARFYSYNGRPLFEVDGARIRRVYQVLPTLDGLGDFGTRMARVAELGVLPGGATPWVVGVTDLNVVTDILTKPGHLIGYMEFRSRWINEPRLFIPDEIEMLALYLHQVDLGQRLKHFTAKSVLMHATEQWRFDDYYAGQSGLGPVTSKPIVTTTKRFRRFIDEIQRIKPEGWLATATAALQVPLTISTMIDELEKDIALEAKLNGLSLKWEEDYAVAALGDQAPTELLNQRSVAQVLADKPLIVVLRQHGGMLRIENVLFNYRQRPESRQASFEAAQLESRLA